jgi:hypothetical protein
MGRLEEGYYENNWTNKETREYGIQRSIIIFMFAPCINIIKTLIIVPTDAHYYKYHLLRLYRTSTENHTS